MVAPTDHRTSLSREMSLRRSFIAIHESTPLMPRPSASHHGHHRDKAITKSKSYHGHNNVSRRQFTEETHAAASLKENLWAVAPPPLRVEELPSLPFSSNNNAERRQSVPSAKFQRRRSPLATAVADEEMAARLVEDSKPIIKRSEDSSHDHHHHHQEHHQRHHHEGFRKDYRLGEALRSPAHIIQRGLVAIDSLKKHDFAFVKRSDGSSSYAILAFRSLEPAREEECMTFVVSAAGSTKTVHRRHWAESVRMVAPSMTPPVNDEPDAVLCRDIVDDNYEEEDGDDCWVLPGMISFESLAVAAEECSLISSVSDRAMHLRRGRCQSA